MAAIPSEDLENFRRHLATLTPEGWDAHTIAVLRAVEEAVVALRDGEGNDAAEEALMNALPAFPSSLGLSQLAAWRIEGLTDNPREVNDPETARAEREALTAYLEAPKASIIR